MFMILRFCHYLWLIDRVLPFKKNHSTECLICSSGTTSWSIWHPSSISTPLVVCSTTKWDIPPLHAFSSQWRGTICMLLVEVCFLWHKLCRSFNKYNIIIFLSQNKTSFHCSSTSFKWFVEPALSQSNRPKGISTYSVLVILASNHTYLWVLVYSATGQKLGLRLL